MPSNYSFSCLLLMSPGYHQHWHEKQQQANAHVCIIILNKIVLAIVVVVVVMVGSYCYEIILCIQMSYIWHIGAKLIKRLHNDYYCCYYCFQCVYRHMPPLIVIVVVIVSSNSLFLCVSEWIYLYYIILKIERKKTWI